MRARSLFNSFCVILVILPGDLPAQQATVAESNVDFAKDVLPILQDKCLECHDASMQMAELRLDSRRAMIDSGVVVPGDVNDSLLLQRLYDRDLGILMPPTGKLDRNQIEVLKKWVGAGATWPVDISVSTNSRAINETSEVKAFFAAIRNDDLDAVRKMLRDESLVAATDKHGTTPLMHAALYSSSSMVLTLLDRKADPNTKDSNGMTALMYAAGGEFTKTRLLLNHGGNVGVKSEMGRTALLMASAYAGNDRLVKALIDAGADVNFADKRKWTALILAARTGDRELVRTLLDAGADVNGGNSNRRSPGTALMQAAWASDLECAKLLLEQGADTDKQAINTSLIFAATHGSQELVELLVGTAGADPQAKVVTNYVPETSILAAAYSDSMNADIVRTLLKKGVDVKAKDSRGETPLSIARQRGDSEIVALLRETVQQKSTAEAGSNDNDTAKRAVSELAIKRISQKSVALLQSCGPNFFAKSGCTACHQQTVTSLAVQMARARGVDVDEIVERRQAKLTSVDLRRSRVGYLQRMKSGGTAHRLGYLLWGLAAADYPADEITDAAFVELAGLQLRNGSWVSDAYRPPTEYSPVTATAVSMRGIQLFSPPGLKASTAERVTRGTQWLENAPATANAEKAFRLLGLYWGRSDSPAIEQAKTELLNEQASDGGWSQLPSLQPDAYATGLTLYALAQAKAISNQHPAYRKGVEFLMNTVGEDGSWHVRSRSFKFQPYFESGFPHGDDQWISAAATGWATMALLQTIEPNLKVAQSDDKFADYPAPVNFYLSQLHGTAEKPKGELRFRADYPGGFYAWQRDAREKLAELLGLDRMQREIGTHQPIVQLAEVIQEDGYRRRRGQIETESRVTIPFWLLTPDEKLPQPRQLVICAHGHDSDGWNTYAGVYRDEKHRASTIGKDGDVGVQAVKRGFVVIVPATRGLAEAVSVPDMKGRHGKRDCRAQLMHCLLAGRTAVGERVWDTQRLLDWALGNLDGIDHEKVVLLGNSGGGVLTVYTAALDERIAVAIPSCSFTSFTSSTGYVFHCDCCLVPRAQVELGDMADIGALTAPRSLLAVHGRQDKLHSHDDVNVAMQRVSEVYTAAGVPHRFQHKWGAAGHKFYPELMWPFVDAALRASD